VARRDEIVRYLDETLEAALYRDHLPLGLQVPGADQVEHVCTAVSASLDVFERAAADGAQMLVVHHGLFWDGSPRRIGMLERRRLETLFTNDLSLVAYHLPLDGHHELGNNAVLAALLGLADVEPFGEYRGRLLGRCGTLSEPEPAAALATRLGAAIGSRPLVFAGGADPVRTVGVISGGAAKDIATAAELGLDCFITGEPDEDSPYLAAELRVTLIAAGHNATETVGVQALGQRLVEEFGVTTTFLPVENPV
jgi:dinuclear metal center YbgI/SA1388 family protein